MWLLVAICFTFSQATVLDTSKSNIKTCALKEMKMKIYEPGCEVKNIQTMGCSGYCVSSSMYLLNIQDMRIKCKCCKVKGYLLRFAQMKCPLLETKSKIIPYREATKCECQDCS